MIITLNYHMQATFHTISKIHFQIFVKSLVKKILTLSQFLIHSKLKIIFHIKTQFLMILDLSQYINLLEFAVVLAKLAKLAIILRLGLRSISKRITSLIYLNIQTPPQHANSLCFKINSKAKLTLNSAYKLKKLYILTGENLT